MTVNELNTKKFSHFSDCVEKLNIKCGGAEKIGRRLNGSVDDFDSIEIRLGKSAKFDGAGVYKHYISEGCLDLSRYLTQLFTIMLMNDQLWQSEAVERST